MNKTAVQWHCKSGIFYIQFRVTRSVIDNYCRANSFKRNLFFLLLLLLKCVYVRTNVHHMYRGLNTLSELRSNLTPPPPILCMCKIIVWEATRQCVEDWLETVSGF
jgi:hypothetical protein